MRVEGNNPMKYIPLLTGDSSDSSSAIFLWKQTNVKAEKRRSIRLFHFIEYM